MIWEERGSQDDKWRWVRIKGIMSKRGRDNGWERQKGDSSYPKSKERTVTWETVIQGGRKEKY